MVSLQVRDRRDSGGREAVLAVPELAQQWRDLLLVLARRALLPLRDFGTEDSQPLVRWSGPSLAFSSSPSGLGPAGTSGATVACADA